MMRMTALSGLLVAFSLATAQAGDVAVKGVHLCCGKCTKAVGSALGKVDGVSGAKCDRETGTVTFSASDEKTAKAGVRAILAAGLFGRATLDGEKLNLYAGKKKNKKKRSPKKADSVTLRSVHLCCPKCVKAAAAALKGVDGVSDVECDTETGTITLTGKDIVVQKSVQALHKAGFHGTTRKPKKKKS